MNEFVSVLIRWAGSPLSSRVSVGDVMNVLFALAVLVLVALVLLVHEGIEFRREHEREHHGHEHHADHWWLRHRH